MVLVMAGAEGLEPAASGVTGLRPGQPSGALVPDLADLADLADTGNLLHLHQEYPINSMTESL